MHDPHTLAFEIKYPWYRYRPWPKAARQDPHPAELKHRFQQLPEAVKQRCDSHWPEGYRDTFITIWHVDPQRHGSDDSCGWCYPKLTPAQREKLRNAAWHEGSNPHFLRCHGKEWRGAIADVECLYRGLAFLVSRVLELKLTADEIHLYAIEATHVRDVIKAGDAFCFLPGYHTNNPKDSEEDRREHFHKILCGVARSLLRQQRPWWQHPRWHLHHWKIQIHPVQKFKRWAFSRCEKCGGGFGYGESPVTDCWDGTGPLWFRSEKHVRHMQCGTSCPVAENKPLVDTTPN